LGFFGGKNKMIIAKIFILSSILSFLFLAIVLTYYSILKKNNFGFALKRILQMEKLSDEEIKNLNRYIDDSSSEILRWFSYYVLEKSNDKKFLEKSFFDLNNKSSLIQSGAINYIGNFPELNNLNKLFPFLKNENLILKLHTINSIKNISLKNFENFKREFEARPNQLIDPALNLFYDLKKEEKKELFLIIKKFFNLKEDIILKTLDFFNDFADENLYEEILYQLDIFPISFQEKFVKLFSKNMDLKKYIPFFEFKLKTIPEKAKYIYIYPFALYFSDLDFKKAAEFANNLNEREMEEFLENYFTDPEKYLNFLIILKNIPSNSFDLIIEKLSLLKSPKTIDVLENILNYCKEKDKILFRFSNLIIHWEKEDKKKILFWILTKIENPSYREKIENIIKEMKFDN